jgi:O-methyltransferase involved in polyketide biosynthesis
MRQGTASRTARGVAAHRLQYPRIEAAHGDPAADEALTRDVAGGMTPEHDRMHEYLRARTAVFDRMVVTALGGGVSQVVIGGAGYDGRAFRYAKPGVLSLFASSDRTCSSGWTAPVDPTRFMFAGSDRA